MGLTDYSMMDKEFYLAGVRAENDRIINLLIDLNAIRRDAFGHLVAFNTDGTEVIYLPGLEFSGDQKIAS